MKQWAQALQATVQMTSELVAREWRSTAEWQAASTVPRETFVQIVRWMEAFAGQTTGAAFLLQREQQRLLATQVRDELYVLLAELEPQQALALLCSLPSAEELGYSQPHLAQFAELPYLQVQEWEQQAYQRLHELVSQRTPFLQFLMGQVAGEGTSPPPAAQEDQEDQAAKPDQDTEQARLLQEARRNPRFDLRLYLKPIEELSIRKRVHRARLLDPDRVETLFGNQAPFLVRLVMERMKLEMAEGEEERADVDDGSA